MAKFTSITPRRAFHHLQSLMNAWRSLSRRTIVGLTSLWTIWILFFLDAACFSPVPLSEPTLWSIVASRLAIVLVAALSILKARSRKALSLPPRYLGAIVFAIGIFVSYIISFYITSDSPKTTFAAILLGGLLEGAGFTLLALGWAPFFSGAKPQQICLTTFLSFALALVTYFGLVFLADLSYLAKTFVLFALPLFAVLWQPTTKTLASPVTTERVHLLLASVMLCGFVFGLVQETGYTAPNINPFTSGLIACATTLIISTFFLALAGPAPASRLREVHKLTLPIISLGFLVYPFAGDTPLAISLVIIFAGHAWFILCALLTALDIGCGPLAIMLIVGTEALGTACGNLVFLLVSPHLPTPHFTYQVALVAATLMFLAISFVFDRSLKVAVPFMGPQQGVVSTGLLDSMADHFGLTKREREVFRLLIARQRADEIASKLNVSVSTVRTHIHNVYAKCGVGSYKELAELVRSYASTECH